MDMSKSGETAIKMFYKYPLGFLFSGDNEMAQNVYNYIIKQEPNESARDFNTYYDCWLYLYTKFSNNTNSNIHYQKILKNKSIFWRLWRLAKFKSRIKSYSDKFNMLIFRNGYYNF